MQAHSTSSYLKGRKKYACNETDIGSLFAFADWLDQMLDCLIVLCQGEAALAFTPVWLKYCVVSIRKSFVDGTQRKDSMLYYRLMKGSLGNFVSDDTLSCDNRATDAENEVGPKFRRKESSKLRASPGTEILKTSCLVGVAELMDIWTDNCEGIHSGISL